MEKIISKIIKKQKKGGKMKNIEREVLEDKAETLQEILSVDYFLQELLQSMSNQELRDALVFIDRNNETELFNGGNNE